MGARAEGGEALREALRRTTSRRCSVCAQANQCFLVGSFRCSSCHQVAPRRLVWLITAVRASRWGVRCGSDSDSSRVGTVSKRVQKSRRSGVNRSLAVYPTPSMSDAKKDEEKEDDELCVKIHALMNTL